MLKKNFNYKYLMFFIPLCVYAFCLNGPGYFDDVVIFQNNHWLLSGPKPSWFHVIFLDHQHSFPGYRPVLMQLSQWNTQLFGQSFFSWRMVNLLIHIANASLLYVVLRSFKLNQKIALCISLLFALHPIQTIAVQFVWKRSSTLSLLFILIGLCQYAYLNCNKWLTAVFQITIYGLAFLCKESAVVYPMLLLSFIVFNRDQFKSVQKKDCALLTVLFMCAGIMCWFRLYYLPDLYEPYLGQMSKNRVFSKETYFLSSMRSVIHYIGWFFNPNPLLLNDPLPIKQWLNGYTVSYFFLIVISIVSLLNRTVPQVCKFFIVGFWLCMFPHSSFYPMYNLEDQIRMYFAIAALSVFTTLAIDKILSMWTRFSIEHVFIPILSVLAGLSFLQNIKYYSPEMIWSDVTQAYDYSDFAHAELGDVYFKKQDYQKSINHYQQAFKVSSKPYYRIKIARSIWYQDHKKQSVYDVLKPLNFNLLNIEEFSDFLSVFILMKDYKKAEWLLGQVIARFHHNERLLLTAGRLYFLQQDYAKAKVFFNQVLKRNPNHALALQYLTELR